MPIEVGRRAVDGEPVVRELAHHVGAGARPLDADRQVGLALGEVDEARHRQQVDVDRRVTLAEVRQQRRQEGAAEALGGTQAHVPGEHLVVAGNGGIGHGERALDLLDRGQQAPADWRQHMALRTAVEELAADVVLELLQPARDRRMVELQRGRRLERRAAACDGEEDPKVVPVDVHGPTRGMGAGRPLRVALDVRGCTAAARPCADGLHQRRHRFSRAAATAQSRAHPDRPLNGRVKRHDARGDKP